MMHTTYGIFPVPIYCNDLGRGFTVEEMDAIQSYSTDCQVGISGNNMSNSASVLDNPVLKDLKAFVEQNIATYLAEVEAPSDDVGAYITHSFLNFIDKGQGHFRHAHFNSFISGVLYINANRDTDRIHFYREKYSYFPHFNRKSNNGFNADSWQFPVWTGRLILFPSHIQHSVEVTDSNYTRISLAFNTFLKGEIGNKETYDNLRL